MADSIKAVIDNQFVSGGLVLMVTGAVMGILRNTPFTVWHWLKRQVMIEIDIVDSDPMFEWVNLWLHQHPYSKKTRLLSISTKLDGYDEADPTSGAQVIFSPAPGNHFFVYKGRMVWLERNRSEPGGAGGVAAPIGGSKASTRIETIRIKILGRSQQIAREIVQDIVFSVREFNRSRVPAFMSQSGWWKRISGYVPRKLDTVILPEGKLAEIIGDLGVFLESRDWYVANGIPYHRGYLFSGIPGSGKTSAITAIAGHYRMPLYILNIGGQRMSDEGLYDLMSSVQPRSVLLLEDVDTVAPERKKTATPVVEGGSEGGITLAGLLNCLDGVVTKDGCVVFMTTNFRDQLDPALIRPGRVDLEVAFDYADIRQAFEMFTRFFPEEFQLARRFAVEAHQKPRTMADLQQVIVKNRHSPQDVVSAMMEAPAILQLAEERSHKPSVPSSSLGSGTN